MIINDDYKNIIDAIIKDCEYEPILVIDPPFNIGYHYSKYNDKKDESIYYQDLVSLINKFDKSVVIHYPEQLHKLSIALGVAPNRVCSWVYNSNTPKQHRDIGFYGFNPDMKKRGQDYKNPNDKRIKRLIEQGKRARLYDWWNINQIKNTSKEKTKHPCQMPLDVMVNIIGSLPDNVIVIDTFAGSGTTLLACQRLNVPFIGIEIDNSYCDIIKKRLKND